MLPETIWDDDCSIPERGAIRKGRAIYRDEVAVRIAGILVTFAINIGYPGYANEGSI